ncbi:Aste57867_13817 [Aphanomyces stellatus]|uniref:HEAT repeat-containing protein 1 n=1 Tax=Aphanomyces stellatus TaxID=120398 RepID=A0A485L008_9STRA|nr:hypothetical protein As57867_013767 [Aphanomyces stellatus]VFT90649.1 Aste57867_13817 [Aphanomyces stellatus]
MSTSLASQLNALKAQSTSAPSQRKLASFVHDPKVAAKIDLRTTFEHAKQALDHLCAMDGALDVYHTSLLHQSKVQAQFHRSLLTKEENAALDVELGGLLDALSPYFLLPPTHQVLEYLIRRYEVHTWNVEQLLGATLCYHESPVFARLVTILDLGKAGARWSFLEPVKANNVPLLRANLAKRCFTDASIVRFIYDAARRIGSKNPKLMALYTLLAMEVVDKSKITDQILRWVLPNVFDGLRDRAYPEHQLASYMIATKLASKATIAHAARSQLVVAIAKSAPAHAQLDALLCLIGVVQAQPFDTLPVDALKHMLQYDDVPQLLRDAMDAYDASKFLKLFFAAVVALLAADPAAERIFFDVVGELQSDAAPYMEDVVRSVLTQAHAHSKANDVHQRVLVHISKRYADKLDAGLNALLQELGDESDDETKAFFVAFVAQTFDGSSAAAMHVPLAESGLSLLLSLDHPNADIRVNALQAVGKLSAFDEPDVLLRRLNDDSPAVVVAATKIGALLLESAAPLALLDAVAHAVNQRATDINFKAALSALLSFVTGPFAKKHAGFDNAILDILLVFAPSSWLVATTTPVIEFAKWVGFLKTLQHPFGQALKAPKDLSAIATAWSQVLKANTTLLETVQSWAAPTPFRHVALPYLAMHVLFLARKDQPAGVPILMSLVRDAWTTVNASVPIEGIHRPSLVHVVEMVATIMTHESNNYDDALSLLLHAAPKYFEVVQPALHDTLAKHSWSGLLTSLCRLVHRADTHERATVRALTLVAVMVECNPTALKLADLHHVMLTLLVAMHTKSPAIRKTAVQGLKPLAKVSIDKLDRAALAPYTKAMLALAHVKAELTMDHQYITTLCHDLVDNQGLDVTWLKAIVGAALGKSSDALSVPLKLRAAQVLNVLAKVEHVGVWESTLTWFSHTIASVHSSETAPVGVEDRTLLKQLVSHYLTNWTKPPKAVFDAILAALSTAGLAPVHKHIALTMPAAWYAGLSPAHQSTLVAALVQLLRSGEDVSDIGSQLLPRLQVSADIMAKLLHHTKVNSWAADVTCVLEVLPSLLPHYKPTELEALLTPLQHILTHFTQDKVSEYSVQMVLTVLHATCVQLPKAATEATKAKASHAKTLVELTMQVVEATTSPQTRNAALLFVSSLVDLYPTQVLHSLVPILSHASNLHMDEYSFHVLQEIVQHAVPYVTRDTSPIKPQQFLQTFVAAFDSIPAIRRTELFHVVLSSLAVNHEDSLGLGLVLLLHSMASETEARRSSFCHTLAELFSPEQQMRALVFLVETTGHLQDGDGAFVLSGSTDATVAYLLSFVPLHLQRKSLHLQILDQDAAALQEAYLGLAQALLLYLRRGADHDDDLSGFAMDGMHNLQQLLTTPGFVAVIGELLQHDDSVIRRRALTLFNERIEETEGSLTPEEELLFVDMLSDLSDALTNASDALVSDLQMALLSVDVLTRFFAKKHPTTFLPVLPTVLTCTTHANGHVVGSAFVCLSNLSLALGPAVFPYVPKFFPTLLAALEGSIESTDETHTLQQCCMVALRNFTAKFPQFLVPYLPRMLHLLFLPTLTHAQVRVAAQASLTSLAHGMELRNLLPALQDMYPVCCGHGPDALVQLFDLLSTIVASMDRTAVKTHLTNLMRFFLMAMDGRRLHPVTFAADVVEDKLLQAILQLVLKLSEKQLKPLFLKFVSWVDVVLPGDAAPSVARQAVFFRLVVRLSDQLRSIFVPYFAHILPQCATVCEWGATDLVNTDEADGFFQRPTKKQKTDKNSTSAADKTQVVLYVVQSLHGCFVHDTDGFMDKEKFDAIMPSLVDLVELAGRHPDIVSVVVKALAHLAWAAKNDLLWKPMHHRLLMKARSDDAAVRLATLQAIEQCYTVVGEEFLAMLPESIPFLAELLEDTDADVEALCHKVIKQIEEISGESLDQYLTA